MALTKEEQEIALKITNLAELQRLNRELATEEQAIRDVTKALYQGTITQTAYETTVSASVKSIQSHSAAIKILDKQTRDYRQNMMALSYVGNDFLSVQGGIQQRLNAIANNMPMLLAGFGMLGPALSAILPAAGMLIANLDNIKKAMGFDVAVKLAVDAIDRLKNNLKELEDKPVKLSMDVTAIKQAQGLVEKFQENLANFRQAEEMRTARQEKAASDTKRILAEANAPKTFGKLRDAEAKRIEAGDSTLGQLDKQTAESKIKAGAFAKMQAANLDPDAAIGLELAKKEAEAETKRLEDERRKRLIQIRDPKQGDAAAAVGERITAAEKGDVKPLADMLEKGGFRQQAADIRATTPAAQKAAERGERDATATIKEALRSTVADVIVPAIRAPGEAKTRKAKAEAADEARRKARAANSASTPASGKPTKQFKRIPQLGAPGSGPSAAGPVAQADPDADPRVRFNRIPQLGASPRGAGRRTKGRAKGVTMGPTAAQTARQAQGVRDDQAQQQHAQNDQNTIAGAAGQQAAGQQAGKPAVDAAAQMRAYLEAMRAENQAYRENAEAMWNMLTPAVQASMTQTYWIRENQRQQMTQSYQFGGTTQR